MQHSDINSKLIIKLGGPNAPLEEDSVSVQLAGGPMVKLNFVKSISLDDQGNRELVMYTPEVFAEVVVSDRTAEAILAIERSKGPHLGFMTDDDVKTLRCYTKFFIEGHEEAAREFAHVVEKILTACLAGHPVAKEGE